MKNIPSTMITVAIAFIVTFVLNAGLNYLQQPDGTVQIGPALTIQGQIYMPVDLANYTSHSIDNITLSVPADTDIQRIISSSPLVVEKINNSVAPTNSIRVRVSGLEANQITKIQIPVSSPLGTAEVSVTNAAQVSLRILDTKGIYNPLATVFLGAILIALEYAVVVGILYYWINSIADKRGQDLKNQMTTLQKELGAAEKKSMEAAQETNEVAKQTQKLKILYLARMSDYARELSFWRDTVRKVLYQAGTDRKAVERVIDSVTENLKTYGTNDGVGAEFDTIKAMAEMISFSERARSTSEDGK